MLRRVEDSMNVEEIGDTVEFWRGGAEIVGTGTRGRVTDDE